MDKGLFIFIAMGVIFTYLINNFIGEIQEEDSSYKSGEYKKKHQYDQYKTIDSVGDEILDVSSVNLATQIAVWNASQLKNEFLETFPNFFEMQKFIKNRVVGDELKEKILQTLEEVEGKFLEGSINGVQAKQKLSSLKS